MTIEITDDERVILLHSLIAYQVDTNRYLEIFSDSKITNEMKEEIELLDSLYNKIFNVIFE